MDLPYLCAVASPLSLVWKVNLLFCASVKAKARIYESGNIATGYSEHHQ